MEREGRSMAGVTNLPKPVKMTKLRPLPVQCFLSPHHAPLLLLYHAGDRAILSVCLTHHHKMSDFYWRLNPLPRQHGSRVDP